MKMQVEVTGSGTPVVLVPGGLTGWLSWKPHANLLSATHRVIRVQLLNVQLGLENKPLTSEYSVRAESHALESTLADLDLSGPVDLVAWSYGGLITLDYALRHPERVRTLTLIEPPALWVLREGGSIDNETKRVIGLLQAPLDTVTESDLETFAQNVGLLQPHQKGSSLPQWPVWMEHRFSIRNNSFVVAHNDSLAKIDAFTPRVLLVKGTGSARFLHKIIDTLAAHFPHAEVIELPAGHAPQIVSMETFLAKLKTFQEESAGR